MMIDALATLISPAGTRLPDERREHMLLYNLLGDPTFQLGHPEPLKLGCSTSDLDPGHLQVTITSPISGDLMITVDRPLGAVQSGDANNTLVVQTETTAVADQEKIVELGIPAETVGPIVVRAMVSGTDAWASSALKTILNE